MRRFLLTMIIVAACVSTMVVASDLRFPRSNNYLVIQVEKPAESEGPAVLNVIWCNKKPSGEVAEAVLVQAFEIVQSLNLNRDILGSNWYSATGREEDEDMVPLASGNLMYVLKKGQKKPQPYM